MHDLFINGTPTTQMIEAVRKYPRLTSAGFEPPDMVNGYFSAEELAEGKRQFSVQGIETAAVLMHLLMHPRPHHRREYNVGFQPPTLLQKFRDVWEHHSVTHRYPFPSISAGDLTIAATILDVPIGFDDREEPMLAIHLPFIWVEWKPESQPLDPYYWSRVRADAEPMWMFTPYWELHEPYEVLVTDVPMNRHQLLAARPDLRERDPTKLPPDDIWYRFELNEGMINYLVMEYKL